jgi:multiple sugar transport system ATP-binding protein
VQGDGQLRLSADGLVLEGLSMSSGIGAALGASRTLTLGIRPEHLTIAEPGMANTISGKLFANENMGPESLVTIERADGSRLTARVFTDDHIELDEAVTLGFASEHVHLFDGTGARIPADGEKAL